MLFSQDVSGPRGDVGLSGGEPANETSAIDQLLESLLAEQGSVAPAASATRERLTKHNTDPDPDQAAVDAPHNTVAHQGNVSPCRVQPAAFEPRVRPHHVGQGKSDQPHADQARDEHVPPRRLSFVSHVVPENAPLVTPRLVPQPVLPPVVPSRQVLPQTESHTAFARPYRPVVTSGLVLSCTCEARDTTTSLQLLADDRRDVVHVKLCDEWRRTLVRPGDRINLVGELRSCGCDGTSHARCTALSRDSGPLLVLRPEVMVTGTALAKSCSCPRRAVLSRARKDFDLGIQLVLGTIKHRLFEHLMCTWNASTQPDQAHWERILEDALREHMPELHALQMDESKTRQELRQAMHVLRGWARSFLPHSGEGRPILVRDGFGQPPADSPSVSGPVELLLKGVAATEEDVSSLVYGLKGKLDATVQVEIRTPHERGVMSIPLELKTGKRTSYNINDHNAQVLVYSILLSDQQERRVPAGLLYYPQLANESDQGMYVTKAEPPLLASLLGLRNGLVAGAAPHAHRDGRMPELLRSAHECGRCP